MCSTARKISILNTHTKIYISTKTLYVDRVRGGGVGEGAATGLAGQQGCKGNLIARRSCYIKIKEINNKTWEREANG
jgi:predicted ATP-dependent serine protease